MNRSVLKRAFSVVLSLVLMLSLSPLAYAAADPQPSPACTGLADCPAAQHNASCLKAAAASAPAENAGAGSEGASVNAVPDPTACTCGAAEGAAHAEGCPKYTAPVPETPSPAACTCGAAEGAPHAESCPKYTAPAPETPDPADCTCGAAAGAAHAEGCPKYTAPAPETPDPADCICDAAEGAAHKPGCPLFALPADEAVAIVQAMIDALPKADTVAPENADDVMLQLEAIDEAKLLLTDEQLDMLNIEKYVAVAAALGVVYDTMALESPVAKIGDTEYATLPAAISAAKAGNVITLIDDVTNCKTISLTKKITIDLNNHNISFAENGTFWITRSTLTLTGKGTVSESVYNTAPVTLLGYGTLTSYLANVIVGKDVTLEGWAGVFIQGKNNSSNASGVSAKISGTIKAAGPGVYVNGNVKATSGKALPKITLDGATVSGSCGMYLAGYALTTVKNSTVTGTKTGIEIRAGELTVESSNITGGTGQYDFVSNGSGATSSNVALAIAQHTTQLPIKVKVLNGNLKGGAAFAEANPENTPPEAVDKIEVDIQGGNFTGEVKSTDKKDFITGGSFSTDVSAYVPDGYEANKAGGASTGYVVVKDTTPSADNVAEVNGQYFRSVQAAIEAVAATNAPGTVRIIKDTAESVSIPAGADITLDIADGVTLTDNGGHTISNSGTLTVTGKGTVKNTAAGHGALANYPGASADLNGGAFVGDQWYVIKNLGTMKINGASVTQNDAGSSGIANGYYGNPVNDLELTADSSAVATLTIDTGTFSGGMNTVKNDDYGVLTINGGTFSNTNGPTILNWNEATITGGSFTVNDTASSVVANGHLNETSDKGQLTISGGTFTAANGGQGVLFGYGDGSTAGGSLTISNGKFEGLLATDSSYPYTPVVSGGTFSHPVAPAYCAPGYSPTDKDASGNYTVCNHPADKMQTVAAVDATCAAPGHQTYYHCTVCGRNFTQEAGVLTEITDLSRIEIPADPTKHSYNTAWSYDESQHWHECTVCHDKKDLEIHTFQWVADANGVKHNVCVCGYSNKVTLTLHFDANQGRRAPADQTVDTDTGSGTIVITRQKPSRFGYVFQGWSTSAAGPLQYRPGSSITITRDTTLYAVWALPTAAPLTGDTSNIFLWAAVAGVCLAGLVTAAVIIVKKGRKK